MSVTSYFCWCLVNRAKSIHLIIIQVNKFRSIAFKNCQRSSIIDITIASLKFSSSLPLSSTSRCRFVTKGDNNALYKALYCANFAK